RALSSLRSGRLLATVKLTPRISTACTHRETNKMKPKPSWGRPSETSCPSGRDVAAPKASAVWQSSGDAVSQSAPDVDAELRVEFANTGGTGDVHFGQVVTNHVEADKHQATGLQLRADLRADPAVTLAQLDAPGRAARCQVAAGFVGGRDARQCIA